MTYQGQPPQEPWPPQQPRYSQQQYPPAGQPPYQQYGPPQPGRPRRRSWMRRHKILTALGSVFAVIVIGVAAASGHKAPSAAPPAADAAATTRAATTQAAALAAAPQITYLVTGTPGSATVTYGPEGSSIDGHVPMRITKKLGNAGYYDVQAQLQGSGHVTVRILIDGKVISSGSASGGYNIASAEIIQDPVTGQWQDAQQ